MWRKFLCILLIISLTLLTGCWSRKELNDLALVMALGIDLDPGGYAVTVQVMNPGEAGNQKGGRSGGCLWLPIRPLAELFPMRCSAC